MKTVIFSDTHFTKKFEKKRFEFLKHVLQNADRVIINGDFWDGYQCTFDDFVTSEWQILFPLLREKQAIYLYGNHDPQSWCDERVNLFSVEQRDRFEIMVDGIKARVEHGHLLHKFRGGSHQSRRISFADRWYNRFESLLYKFFGYNSKYFFPDKLFDWLHAREYAKDHAGENEIFIFGHCHLARYEPENHLIILGDIKNGYGSYLTVDDDHFYLQKVRYSRWYDD